MSEHLNRISIFSIEIGDEYHYPRDYTLKEWLKLYSGSKITIINIATQNNWSKSENSIYFKIEHSGNIQETHLEENLFKTFFSRYKIMKQNRVATSREYLHEAILAKLW